MHHDGKASGQGDAGLASPAAPKASEVCTPTPGMLMCIWQSLRASPDLSPIERAFVRIKHWMRDAQKRTIEETWRHIGHLVSTIEPSECANYFAGAGYASVKS